MKKNRHITSEPLERLFAMTPDQYAFCIIEYLGQHSPIRFSKLQALLDLNPTTLTARLRQLQTMGLVVRQAFSSVPPRVEYSLTPTGRSLFQQVASLARWAGKNCPPLAGSTVNETARTIRAHN